MPSSAVPDKRLLNVIIRRYPLEQALNHFPMLGFQGLHELVDGRLRPPVFPCQEATESNGTGHLSFQMVVVEGPIVPERPVTANPTKFYLNIYIN